MAESWEDTSDSLKAATVLAAFAEILRNSPHASDLDLDDVAEAADQLADLTGDRAIDDLADMIDAAARLG